MSRRERDSDNYFYSEDLRKKNVRKIRFFPICSLRNDMVQLHIPVLCNIFLGNFFAITKKMVPLKRSISICQSNSPQKPNRKWSTEQKNAANHHRIICRNALKLWFFITIGLRVKNRHKRKSVANEKPQMHKRQKYK